MAQIFTDTGEAVPVTVIKLGPLVVTQVKTAERDGYRAVQVGFGVKKEKNISKPVRGHLKNLGNFRFLKEFRLLSDAVTYAVGDTVPLPFKEGDMVAVSSTSKGKGFQGTVRRHHFKGGPRTHGQKHSEREPGAIGGGARAGGRVAKGMRMSGRMGGHRITVKNLTVAAVDSENGEICVKGAVPGVRGALVELVGA